MVFKFFKEMIDAVKEGIDEGKAELAEVATQARAVEDAADAQDRESLSKRVGREMFLVSLGAPYRSFFVAEDTLSCGTFFIDPKKRAEVAKLLIRDFGIDDFSSARGAAATMQTVIYAGLINARLEYDLENGDANADETNKIAIDFEAIMDATQRDSEQAGSNPDVLVANQIARCAQAKAMLSLDYRHYVDAAACATMTANIARMSYCISISASLGYLAHKEALELMDPIGELAVSLMTGWDIFGEAFMAGEDISKLNNVLGRKLLKDATKSLLRKTNGPWQVQPWPQSMAELI